MTMRLVAVALFVLAVLLTIASFLAHAFPEFFTSESAAPPLMALSL